MEEEQALANVDPFDPPDEVKNMLSQDELAIVRRQIMKHEQAMVLEWEADEAEAYHMQSMMTGPGDSYVAASGSHPSKQGRGQAKWDQNFHQLGKDSNMPPPLRRYFDELPKENSRAKQPVRSDIMKLFPGQANSIFSIQHPTFAPDLGELPRFSASDPKVVEKARNQQREKDFIDRFDLSCSVDNDLLHPHLRHYFDRRGIKSGYKNRPHVDKVTPKLRPRTPERPSTREKILRYYASDSALLASLGLSKGSPAKVVSGARERGEGDITWGRRCLMFGPDKAVRQGEDNDKIPWVSDHHRMESEDNEILNPLLRHYFERDGLESSFRMRGRHYGRPLPAVMGVPAIPTMGAGVGARIVRGKHQRSV